MDDHEETPRVFLKAYEIKEGSLWRPCDGANYWVIVTEVRGDQVFYQDAKNPKTVWDRDAFHFQVRYERV